jgi:ribosomal protein L24
MKTLLALMLLFGTNVKVVNGFYKGCEGVVVDVNQYAHPVAYEVDMVCTSTTKNSSRTYSLTRSFEGSDLEIIKGE